MSALPPRRALALVAFLLVPVLAWQFGHMSARESAREAAMYGLDGGADADGRARGDGQGADADGPGALERLTAERDVALAAVSGLEARLAEAERTAADDAAELALYRRIESGAGTDGLSVESVEVVDLGTEDAALAVTLVQSRGRHRVSGTLVARLLDDPDDALPMGDPAAFDLRFFQTVRLPLGAAAPGLDDAASPPRVELEVSPDGDRHDRFVEILSLDPIVSKRPGE